LELAILEFWRIGWISRWFWEWFWSNSKIIM